MSNTGNELDLETLQCQCCSSEVIELDIIECDNCGNLVCEDCHEFGLCINCSDSYKEEK